MRSFYRFFISIYHLFVKARHSYQHILYSHQFTNLYMLLTDLFPIFRHFPSSLPKTLLSNEEIAFICVTMPLFVEEWPVMTFFVVVAALLSGVEASYGDNSYPFRKCLDVSHYFSCFLTLIFKQPFIRSFIRSVIFIMAPTNWPYLGPPLWPDSIFCPPFKCCRSVSLIDVNNRQE